MMDGNQMENVRSEQPMVTDGANVVNIQYPENANGTMPVQPKKKKTGLLIGISLCVILLLGTAAGVFGFMKYYEQQDKAASEEIVSIFMKEYGRLNLEDAYETFHPDIRDAVIEEQLDKYMVSGIKGLEQYLDIYYGGMELDYEIDKSRRLEKEELEDLLSEIHDSYREHLDISKAYVYQVTETFSGENGTLKIREEYYVGRDEETWYIIAFTTDKVVKDDVSFSFSEYLAEILFEFNDIMNESISECDGEYLENAFDLIHPETRDMFLEALLRNNNCENLQEYAEKVNSYYGGYSCDLEILQSYYLPEEEWGPILLQIEDYYGVKFDLHLPGIWAFDTNETFTGSNGTACVLETFYVGEGDGQWYIFDVITNEVVSNTVDVSQADDVGTGGYASADEAVEHYLQTFTQREFFEVYDDYHPAIREDVLQNTINIFGDIFGLGSPEEFEEMVNSAAGAGIAFSYEILDSLEVGNGDQDYILDVINDSYGIQLDISEMVVYRVQEEYIIYGETLEAMSYIVVGIDDDRWYILLALVDWEASE